MPLFKQNEDLTIPKTLPLVAENSFISKTPSDDPLPIYDEIKEKLPAPVWESHDAHIELYWKAWELAFAHIKKPAENTGFVSDFIDTAFNGCIFMNDSAFMLMFGKYADRVFKFQKTLDNFYSHQHRDGFICREIDEATGMDRFSRYDPSATGPETMAWSEWEYYLNFGDKERLSSVFAPLMAYHRWMREHFTWRDGSYFTTGWGCFMDNIPRQPEGYHVEYGHGHMVWVDTCLQELNNCKTLLLMANELGKIEFTPELEDEIKLLENVINETLWDEKTGFYYDLWRDGRHNMVRHVGAYWALVSGCASKERADRMIAYLNDENEFKTPNRVPALSRSNRNYCKEGGYWRGGVWPPTNYMVLKGLDNYNEYDLAHEIGKECLSAVVEVYKEFGTIFENYAPEFVNDGKPYKGTWAKPDFVGWGGLFPISILFEYVFGIKPKSNENKILWCIELTEKHGVEKYPFGTDGELTLVCEARANVSEKPNVTFKSNVPVELEIVWGEKGNKQSMTLKSK